MHRKVAVTGCSTYQCNVPILAKQVEFYEDRVLSQPLVYTSQAKKLSWFILRTFYDTHHNVLFQIEVRMKEPVFSELSKTQYRTLRFRLSFLKVRIVM